MTTINDLIKKKLLDPADEDGFMAVADDHVMTLDSDLIHCVSVQEEEEDGVVVEDGTLYITTGQLDLEIGIHAYKWIKL